MEIILSVIFLVVIWAYFKAHDVKACNYSQVHRIDWGKVNYDRAINDLSNSQVNQNILNGKYNKPAVPANKNSDETIYTIDDIYALPDGERAELIDGKIYYMAPLSRHHQKISMFLSRAIGNYIESNDGKCEVYAAPFAVFLNKDDINYLEPDISVICDTSKLDEKGCHGAPDWIIEIVSPSSKPRDYMTKLFKYRMAGVREYWIIDSEKQHVMVYGFENDIVEQYSFGEDIPVGIYEGFTIKID